MNRRLLSFGVVGGLMLGLSLQAIGSADNREGIALDQDKAKSQIKLKGEVKFINFESKNLDKPRKVEYYLPPGHDPKKSYPVIFGADGFAGSNGIVRNEALKVIEALMDAGKVPPLVIVCPVHGPGKMRQMEYLPYKGPLSSPKHYAAHEKFYIEEMIPWAERELGESKERKNRALYGSSNSAPFMLVTANKYPDSFGHILAMMVYGLQLKEYERELKEQPKDPQRFILVVGEKDKHGVDQNQKIEKILKGKNFPVSSSIIPGLGHEARLEWEQLPGCVEAMFGTKK